MDPSVTFNPCIPSGLQQYIDQFIITNHNNEITAEQHNNIENGLLDFILASYRNYNQATVINSAGLYVTNCNQCILVFNNGATGTFQLLDNRWNEWVVRNNSGASKQLIGGISSYLTPTGVSKNYVSSGTVLHIAKGNNGNWYEIDNGVASNTTPKPLVAVVGQPGGPIPGVNSFQDGRLIGLGTQIQILVDSTPQTNFGNAPSFNFDNVQGIISGIYWVTGSGLIIDLNQ